MRGKGITYDTGFIRAEASTHEPFDPAVVQREMRVIHDDLPHRSAPREDFDMASYGVVKVLEGRHGETYPDMAWGPKVALTALASYYGG